MKTSTKIQELLEIKVGDEINIIHDDFTINWDQLDVIIQNIGELL